MEIREEAFLAQSNPFIQSFIEGYETELGQGGVNISGGQKLWLCIARALLKKPKILILDDSTGAVDTATESRIRVIFDSTLKNTTKIIIAKRIPSVKNAQQIIVMDEGCIVGKGSHDQVSTECKAYPEILYSQLVKAVSVK